MIVRRQKFCNAEIQQGNDIEPGKYKDINLKLKRRAKGEKRERVSFAAVSITRVRKISFRTIIRIRSPTIQKNGIEAYQILKQIQIRFSGEIQSERNVFAAVLSERITERKINKIQKIISYASLAENSYSLTNCERTKIRFRLLSSGFGILKSI